jgi:hypothetical protein
MDLSPNVTAPVRHLHGIKVVDTTYRDFLTLLSKKQHREYVSLPEPQADFIPW